VQARQRLAIVLHDCEATVILLPYQLPDSFTPVELGGIEPHRPEIPSPGRLARGSPPPTNTRTVREMSANVSTLAVRVFSSARVALNHRFRCDYAREPFHERLYGLRSPRCHFGKVDLHGDI